MKKFRKNILCGIRSSLPQENNRTSGVRRKGGIIWHTQGSGKTALAAFSNRVIRDYYAKKKVSTRFFFVVDRLDLLTQASVEFTNRGLKVVNCEDKAGFTKELNKSLSTNVGTKSIGEICVVNIQNLKGRCQKQRMNIGRKSRGFSLLMKPTEAIRLQENSSRI